MSAESVARWNAIPMVRTENDTVSGPSSLKRTRDDGEDSDDDVSLVSRSPSPPPPADPMDIDTYDEHLRRPEREVITVDTKIGSSNKGFAMLAKLGWVEGQPLGLSGDARVDPIPFVLKNDFTGLGKTNQDVRMIESTVSQRRELDSERQTRETEEQRKAREASVAKREAVKSEVANVLKAFYCELCDKQFQTVGQYDEHTNSYAHHHKARFRDMQAAQRASFGGQEEIDKRKDKERRREEKELRKLAKAAGIKIAKPPGLAAPADAAIGTNSEAKAGGFKKTGGWATVGAAAATPAAPPTAPTSGAAPPSAGPSQSGWARVAPASDPPRSSSGWAAVPPAPMPATAAPPPPPASSNAPPAFRTGGWTSLETGGRTDAPSSISVPPPVPQVIAEPPPPPSRGGWAPAAPAAPRAAPAIAAAGQGTRPLPQAEPAQSTSKRVESARSGWQQFKAGSSTRRK